MTSTTVLQEIPLFSTLPAADLDVLATRCRAAAFEAGAKIFASGDPGDVFYAITRGRVRVWQKDDDGEEVTFGVLGPGEFFGELSLLDGEPRSANATALERTELVALERAELLRLLEERPRMAVAVLTATGKRLREANQFLRTRASRNVNEEAEEGTVGERVADLVAAFGGSWTFIFVFGGILFGWIGLNSVQFLFHPFDPAPYIGLNLVLSCIAALQAPFIMMSQNRQSAKDRLKADLDYQVNLKNEVSLEKTLSELRELREIDLPKLAECVASLEAGARATP
ncbi:MAG TPA: DUF1003 domain-containing protein [Planctomycetota bacterium]|nr:DUF1003 domain-containing protein [Planctomycetota bacterium]